MIWVSGLLLLIRRDDDDKEYDLPAYESVQGGGPPRYADGNESIQMVDGIPMRVIPLQVIVSESQATNDMATIEEESSPQQNVDVIARQEQPNTQVMIGGSLAIAGGIWYAWAQKTEQKMSRMLGLDSVHYSQRQRAQSMP